MPGGETSDPCEQASTRPPAELGDKQALSRAVFGCTHRGRPDFVRPGFDPCLRPGRPRPYTAAELAYQTGLSAATTDVPALLLEQDAMSARVSAIDDTTDMDVPMTYRSRTFSGGHPVAAPMVSMSAPAAAAFGKTSTFVEHETSISSG